MDGRFVYRPPDAASMGILCGLLALLLVPEVSAQPATDEGPGPALAEHLGGLRGRLLVAADADHTKNGEGSLVRLRDGTLLHAFTRHRRDPDIHNSDYWPAVIAAMTSADEGATWTAPEVLFTSTTGRNVMQASLARLANGDLGLSYSRIDSSAAAVKVFRYSTDEGRTWSEEVLMSPTGGYWTSAHDRMLVLSEGRIVHPLHTKLQMYPPRLATVVAYSDDHGRTWRLSPDTLTVDEAIPAFLETYGDRFQPGFWEASVAERADGSLFMLGRTFTGYQHYTVSEDGGATWTAPAPSTLISGAAPARVERVPGTDDLLVLWNSCCLDPREILLGRRLTLSSAISSDGGMTWHGQRAIESIVPRGGVTRGSSRLSYPSILLSDGRAFITYRAASRDRWPGMMQEYLTVLPVEWFYAARTFHHPDAALPLYRP